MTFSTSLNYVFLRMFFKKANKIAENNDFVQIVLKALIIWDQGFKQALTNQDIASEALFKYRIFFRKKTIETKGVSYTHIVC